MNNVRTKRCSQCLVEKSLEDYHKKLDKRAAKCKDCMNQYIKQFHTISEKSKLSLEGLKRCTSCREIKTMDHFYKNGLSPHTGNQQMNPRCKLCHRRLTEKAGRNNTLKKKYNINLEIYNTMLSNQNGRCKICKLKKEQSLCVDHDHRCCPGVNSCGKCVRGLLCHTCNRGLGLFGDSKQVLENAIRYINDGEFNVKQ